MKRLLLVASAIVSTFIASADEPHRSDGELLSLSTDVRVDYQHLSTDKHTRDDNSGFEGKYLMFRLDGEITPGLTYSWRQRLNKMHFDTNFFDATDWIYLDWRYDNWEFAGGKQTVGIGGWEYDRNPMDLYGTSVFWQNIACFQLGASVGYHFTDGDCLTVQANQSPSHTADNRNLYAYNLMWTGAHGCFSAVWSANMVEYAKGRFINYIALGNRFACDRWTLELDLMNRASRRQTFFAKDCSVMAELAWRPTDAWKVHAKYTYDVNRTGNSDVCVLPGTEMNMIGGGVEFYPLIKKRTSLRMHANCYYGWGRNGNADDLMQDNTVWMSVGVKWHMDIFSLKHK